MYSTPSQPLVAAVSCSVVYWSGPQAACAVSAPTCHSTHKSSRYCRGPAQKAKFSRGYDGGYMTSTDQSKTLIRSSLEGDSGEPYVSRRAAKRARDAARAVDAARTVERIDAKLGLAPVSLLDQRLADWKAERAQAGGEVTTSHGRGHEAGARRAKQDSLTWELWRAQEWARSGMVEPPRAELRTFVLCLVHEGVEQLEG